MDVRARTATESSARRRSASRPAGWTRRDRHARSAAGRGFCLVAVRRGRFRRVAGHDRWSAADRVGRDDGDDRDRSALRVGPCHGVEHRRDTDGRCPFRHRRHDRGTRRSRRRRLARSGIRRGRITRSHAARRPRTGNHRARCSRSGMWQSVRRCRRRLLDPDRRRRGRLTGRSARRQRCVGRHRARARRLDLPARRSVHPSPADDRGATRQDLVIEHHRTGDHHRTEPPDVHHGRSGSAGPVSASRGTRIASRVDHP